MIDRNRVRELAEKPAPTGCASPLQAPTAREGLLEYLEEVEPDVELIRGLRPRSWKRPFAPGG